MNLKQLTYFVAVAEELHFGRAAERLDIAQPPLSRQIKLLEEELGAVLLNRGRSTTTLTQAGERLLERSKSIFSMIEDTRLEVRRLGQGAEGRLRIGFVGSATYGILPNIVKSFRANYPDVNLSLIPMNNHQLHRALISRELDIAFARPALKDPDFVTRRKEDLCASIQHTIVSMLLEQVAVAAEREGITDVAIAGGVSANSGLRTGLTELGDEKGWRVYIPPMGYCTDNAAMISMVGLLDFNEGRVGDLSDAPSPRLPELVPLAQSRES